MTNSFEEISKSIAGQNGKTDANLANDSNHLGGISAEEYATKAWVQAYHGDLESKLRQYINQQDNAVLNEAKEYANSLVRNQDFSDFAEISDLQALNKNLTDKINVDIAAQKQYIDSKTSAIVSDVNSNFKDVDGAITKLNNGLNNSVSSLTNLINGVDDRVDGVNTQISNINNNINELFQSVSDGKEEIAEAITDKGITTSATASFETMANNIRKIETSSEPIEPVDPGEIIVIPEGYMDTSDATATPDKILQGYTAYANGNKLHGTYVPSESSEGGGTIGGVILGEDEVVAKKIYGEAGILISNELAIEGFTVNNSATIPHEVSPITLVGDDYVIADRKIAENVSGEIVVYNINKNKIYHAEPNSKFSYTYEELGIQGEVRCIAASPITLKASDNQRYTQVSIGTSVAIYTYLFRHSGNGELGAYAPYNSEQKVVIENPCNDFNAIAYSNTNSCVFAYYSSGNVHVVEIYWAIAYALETTNVQSSLANNEVKGTFRFSPSDRFIILESWGNTRLSETNLILLDNYYYITQQNYTLDNGVSMVWQHGQLLINSQDNFAILFGNPCSISYDLANKELTLTRLSGNKVIPFEYRRDVSRFATFSKDDKYVYAIKYDQSNTFLGCYKVDYLNTNSQWQLVSSLMPTGGMDNKPTVDIVNNRIFWFNRYEGKFYYYYADPNVKEIIGLQYNGETYQRIIR